MNIEGLKRAKAALTEAENTVSVLSKLLYDAKQKVELCRSLVIAAENATTGFQSPSAIRTDDEMKLDHRSGSAENSSKCKAEFLEWLYNNAQRDWRATEDMCIVLNSWPRFSKQIVDPVLEQLVKDGIVEVQRNSYSNWPNKIRLKPLEYDSDDVY
jgi:hypothetical protein